MKKVSLEKYQKSRETTVEAGGFGFILRRPTVIDIARCEGTRVSIEFAARFVVGWLHIKESDIIPGGDPEPVEFDSEVFTAWIADRPDLWKVIAEGVVESYQRHEQLSAERGNV